MTALKAANLVDTLRGTSNFTVFSPNNDAFSKITEDTLEELLKPENVDQVKDIISRHIVPKVILAKDISHGQTNVTTIGGEDIMIKRTYDEVTIESSAGMANVIQADILASNGVVHIVDAVF